MRPGCNCGAWLWHASKCRSRYITIRQSGALSIDARYYTESPKWPEMMKALADLRQPVTDDIGE